MIKLNTQIELITYGIKQQLFFKKKEREAAAADDDNNAVVVAVEEVEDDQSFDGLHWTTRITSFH